MEPEARPPVGTWPAGPIAVGAGGSPPGEVAAHGPPEEDADLVGSICPPDEDADKLSPPDEDTMSLSTVVNVSTNLEARSRSSMDTSNNLTPSSVPGAEPSDLSSSSSSSRRFCSANNFSISSISTSLANQHQTVPISKKRSID